MSKIIINPTDSDIKIMFEGISYEVKANDSVEVSDSVASFWGRLHKFLEITNAKSVKKEIEELISENTEEVKEAPKTKSSKRTNK